MSIKILIKRLLFLILVIWAASTITFFIPRISSRNPIRERFAQLARIGGFSPEDMEVIVASYNAKFGLDKPLWAQYFDYISSIARFDLGVSFNQYPKKVGGMIADALPWTIVLLFITSVLSFIIGNLLGALAAWPRSPQWVRLAAAPFVLLQGAPPVLVGILLIFFVAFRLKLLPLAGAHSIGVIPAWSWEYALDMAKHQVLPALSIIFGTVGGWVLSMRGMGITILGEDYVLFAEHKGLKPGTIFRDYYLRNALLPQVTGLALAMGTLIVSGALVEGVYGLPGLGGVLGAAITANDFPVIYGIVLFITIGVATLMVLVELLYPLVDPRVRHE